MCNKAGVKTCSRCHGIRYCSTDCQQDDWAVHKLVCKQFTKFGDDQRRSPTQVRAIFFPDTAKRPRFTWLGGPPSGAEINSPASSAASGGGARLLGMNLDSVLDNNPVLHRPLESEIFIMSGRQPPGLRHMLPAQNRPNKSVGAIDPEMESFWTGSLFACGDHDLTPADFRHIVDYLRMECYREAILVLAPSSDETVQGVRLNCAGDTKICLRPHSEVFHVGISMLDDPNTLSSTIGQRIGIPLVAKGVPKAGGLPWHDRRFGPRVTDASDWNWHGCLFTRFEMRPRVEFTPRSFVVARVDRKPLYRMHAHAIVMYCYERMLGRQIVYEDPLGDPELEEIAEGARSAVNDDGIWGVSEDDFRQWYSTWAERPYARALMEREPGVGSPYDV